MELGTIDELGAGPHADQGAQQGCDALANPGAGGADGVGLGVTGESWGHGFGVIRAMVGGRGGGGGWGLGWPEASALPAAVAVSAVVAACASSWAGGRLVSGGRAEGRGVEFHSSINPMVHIRVAAIRAIATV